MLVSSLVLEILVFKKKSVITPHKFSLDDVQKKLIENAGVTVGRNILITDVL
jgi:hypothetical protein